MTEPTTQQKEQFVKLYNKLWNGDKTIEMFKLYPIDKKQVAREIKTMKEHIRNKNSYFPGLAERRSA